jgi:hypothetical protein
MSILLFRSDFGPLCVMAAVIFLTRGALQAIFPAKSILATVKQQDVDILQLVGSRLANRCYRRAEILQFGGRG